MWGGGCPGDLGTGPRGSRAAGAFHSAALGHFLPNEYFARVLLQISSFQVEFSGQTGWASQEAHLCKNARVL